MTQKTETKRAFGVYLSKLKYGTISVLFVVLSLFSLLTGVFSYTRGQAHAATSNTLNFQARLFANGGSLVPDGTYNVEFNLYYSAGGSLWTEDYLNNAVQGVQVKNGYLSASLGSITAFPSTINWDQQLFLGMIVRGAGACATFASCSPADAEMSPRFKLTAVPYAFQAASALGVASNAQTAAATASGNITIQSGNASGSGAASVSGNISIDAGTSTNSTTGTISLGATNASALALGRAGLTTTDAGSLTVSQLITGNLGLTVTGAASSVSGGIINLNDSSNFATNINTGSSIGTTTIGNALSKVTVAGIVQGTNALVFEGSTVDANRTTFVITDPTGSNTITFPNASGTVQLAPTSGSYLQQVPATNAVNTVSPTANSVVALTLNRTSGTATNVLNVNTATTGDLLAQVLVAAGADTQKGLVIQANSGTQSANLLEVQTSAGATAFRVNSTGQVIGSSDTTTANSGATTLRTGNTTAGSALSTGALTIGTGTGSGTNTSSGAISIDTGAKSGSGTTGAISIGTTNSTAVNLGNSVSTNTILGVTNINTTGTLTTTIGNSGAALVVNGATTHNANLTVATGYTFTNASSTQNTSVALTNFNYTGTGNSGTFGSAVTTVDVATSFTVNQTTAGQTLVLATPTNGAAGRTIYVSNIGSQIFTILGFTIAPAGTGQFVYNGSAWTLNGNVGGSGNFIQNGTTLQSTATFSIQSGATGNETARITQFTGQTGALLHIVRADTTTDVLKVDGVTGATLLKGISDSATEFAVQKAGSAVNVFSVDTTNNTSIFRAGTDTGTLSVVTLANTFNTTWIATGTTWTKTATDATHAAGTADTIQPTTPLTIVAGNYYQVTYTTTLVTAGSINFQIGGGVGSASISTNGTFTQTVLATGTGNLIFTPTANFVGRIASVSVNQIVPSKAALQVQNTSAISSLEVRASSDVNSLFLGTNAGASSTVSSGATYNTAVGNNALQYNVSGNNNTAIGSSALINNSTGSNNVSIGSLSTTNNISGSGNTAIGNNALLSNSVSGFNTVIGYNALQALAGNNGGFNTAIGTNALILSNGATGANTAVGANAFNTLSTGGYNTAIGSVAGGSLTSGQQNTFIGDQSGYTDATFATLGTITNSTAIGASAQVQQSSSIVLGNGGNNNLKFGIGNPVPLNFISGGSYRSGDFVGTISQTASNAVVGVGTSFTSDMVGNQIIYADGVSDIIQTFTDGTHITVANTITHASSKYRIYYQGLQVKNDGTAYVQGNSTTQFAVKNGVGTSVLNVDASANVATITGGLTQLTGAVSLTANAASSFTTSSGALTLTGAAASTFSTGAGVLTLQGFGGTTINTPAAAATSVISLLTGNASAGTAGNITLDVGTSSASNGSILIGTAARAQTISVGNSTATTGVTLTAGVSSAIALNAAAITTNATTVALLNTTATTVNAFSAATTLNLDDATSSKAINIGGVTNSGTDTINISTNATAADLISIGSTNSGSTALLTGGASSVNLINASATVAGTTINLNSATVATNATTLALFNTTTTTANILGAATTINLGAITGTLAVKNANQTFGNAAGSGVFTNNGATLNATLALGDLAAGALSVSPTTTVDIYTSISIAPAASGRAYTIPSPTGSVAGRLLFLSNISANTFTISGTTFNPHATATFLFDGTSWNFAGMDGGSNNYIQNQNASDQTTANFRVSGTGQATGGFIAPSIDSISGTLSLGQTTATAVTVGNVANTAAITLQGTVAATYTVGTATGTGAITLGQSTAGQTINIGAAQIANGNTQTIHIGDSATGTGKDIVTLGNANAASQTTIQAGTAGLTLGATAGNIALTTTTSGNISVTSAGTFALASTNLQVSTAGVITLAGGQTQDITTAGAGTSAAITVQPGTSTVVSGTGAALNLRGGNQSGVTSTGGSVIVDAGTGNTINGAVTIGGTNAASIGLGRSGVVTTITGGLTQLTGTVSLTANNTSQISTTAGNLTLDSAATLNLGTTGAIGVTVGNTTNTTAILLQGAAAATYTVGTANNTGGIVLGNSTVNNTIAIGNAISTGTQTINIGAGTPTGAGLANIVIGNSVNAGSTTLQSATTNINSGTIATNQTTVNLLNTTATTLNFGGAATTISIGATTGTLAVKNANQTFGNAAGSGLFTNNGATLNATLAVANDSDGGALGGTPGSPLTAAQTVDVYTSINIAQTSAGQALTLQNPTSSAAGRIVYIQNTGSANFTMYSIVVPTGGSQSFVWNGSAWTASTSAPSLTLQNAYDNSTTPATILTSSSTKGILIKAGGGFDNTALFQIQNAASTSLLNVDSINSRLTVTADQEFNASLGSAYGGFGTLENLINTSEKMDTTFFWTQNNVTGTGDTTVAPNNTTTADTLTATSAGGGIYQDYTTSAIGYYNFSVWVKAGSNKAFSLRIDSTGTGVPATGTAANFTATTSWQRFDVTQQFTSGTPTAIRPNIIITNNGDAIQVWGAQLRTGQTRGVYTSTQGAVIVGKQGLAVNGDLYVQRGQTLRLGDGTACLNPNNLCLDSSGAITAGQTLTLTSSTASAITLNSSAAINLNTGTIATNAASLSLFDTNATTVTALQAGTSISIGATTGTLTVRNANQTFGNAAGSGLLTNNGATLNATLAKTDFATGGSIGTAASTVDIYTSISVLQTTAGQTLTIPTPTNNPTSVFGRLLYISNIGTTGFNLGTATISPGTTATLIWSNTDGAAAGGESWQFAGADASSILNQNTADQTANFRVSGTGRANTSFTTPLVDSITGALSIGTGTATGVTIGGTTNGLAVTLQGAVASTYDIGTATGTGTINLGKSTAGQIINIGGAQVATGNTQTIHIGDSATGTGKDVISIGNTNGASQLTLQSGTAGATLGATAGNIAITTTTSGTITVTSAGTFALSSTNLQVSTAGRITLAGGQAPDITTATAGTSTNVTIRPGDSTTNSGTGSALILQGSNQTGTTSTGGKVSIDGGTGTTTSGTVEINVANDGAISLGKTTGTSTITVGQSTAAQNINIGSANATTGAQVISIGNGTTGAATTVNILSGVGTAGASILNLGDNKQVTQIDLGNIAPAAARTITVAGGGAGFVDTLNLGTGAATVAGGKTINIGTTAPTGAGTNLITLGSATAFANQVTINGGNGAGAISLQAAASGTITVGSQTAANTVNIGTVGAAAFTSTIAIGTSTGATQSVTIGSTTPTGTSTTINGGATGGVSIQVGSTGAISIGNAAASTVNVGTGTFAHTVNVATDATTAQTVAIGSTFAGSTLSLAANGAISLNATGATFSSGARTINIAQSAATVAGGALTVAAGGSGTGAAAVGGALTLQGGASLGSSGNANGGSVTISGGAGFGATGYQGLVNLSSSAFTSSTTVTLASSNSLNTLLANGSNSYGTVPVNATGAGLTLTIDQPNITTVGRILYVTAVNGSSDFTLLLPGTSVSISMKANSTATLIYNGTGWTAAGASSSTDLQAAYNNTLSSAGGAEIVLNNTASSNGLTIRNNASSPIIGTSSASGALLEVQTSIGSNLFSVNNNAAEYATNGGAETAGSATCTSGFPANTWNVTPSAAGTCSRNISIFATGTASAQMTSTAVANQGLANTLNTTLTANLQYNVAFTVKASANFSTLDVYFSKDGTNTAPTTCSTANTVQQSIWTRVSCTFTAPSSGITASNAIFIRQSDAAIHTFYVDNLSVTVNASVNHAVDGTADVGANIGGGTNNWAGINTATVTQETSLIYDTSGAVKVVTGATTGRGVYNNLTAGIVPAISTQYRASFYARGDGTNTATLAVAYTPDNNATSVSCADYNTQVVAVSTYTLVSCIFTTSATAPVTAQQLRITQTAGSATIFYVDSLTVNLNQSTANNVQIGGANNGGPVTLFTLDRSSGAPIAANNDAYLGSMYYDTSSSSIQCYGSTGWGACGAAPDNIVNLTPEFPGAVLNGSGVGTMTADFCANQSGVLTVNASLCDGTGSPAVVGGNFYKWTSPQSSQQTYSIYVSYQLPTTFKSFASDNTVQLTGRVDNTTNAAVTYQMFDSHLGVLTQCGSTETAVTSNANQWQTIGINGNESTSCGFNTSSAGDTVIFKINMKANSNANAYVAGLSFTTKGK